MAGPSPGWRLLFSRLDTERVFCIRRKVDGAPAKILGSGRNRFAASQRNDHPGRPREVNGQRITRQGVQINPKADVVTVDGRHIQPLRHHYVAVHKPRGVLCTRKDERKRALLGDLLPADWDLKPVGRLDRDSEGLIFATNDGEFALRITHPRYELPKVYRVEVEGKVTHRTLKLFTQGVVHRGETLRATEATLISANGTRSLVDLELPKGRTAKFVACLRHKI